MHFEFMRLIEFRRWKSSKTWVIKLWRILCQKFFKTKHVLKNSLKLLNDFKTKLHNKLMRISIQYERRQGKA